MTQLSLSSVAVEFGASTLFQNVTFTVAKGERWGIIGRNGAGKTTLFNLIAGEMAPTRGTIARAPGLRVALLEQHRDFGDAQTVWDAVAASFAELIALEVSLAEQAAQLAEHGERTTPEMLDRYGHDLERFSREGGYEMASRVDAVLHGLGFDPERSRNQPVTQLSGGERGRLGLARELVTPADVLLLDEPTNHLDLETSAWLESYLRGTDETVLLISHDRAFLERVVDHVLHVEDGTATPYTGSYAAFVTQRAERRLSQQRAFDQQQRTVRKEEEFIRRNLAGQNSAQAKGRRKRLERVPRLSAPPGEEDAMALTLETGARGGDRVATLEHVRLALPSTPRDGARVLVEDFTATINRGDVVGFVGPNGAGKSTLLQTLLGERPPDGGDARLGASIVPAWYRQDLTQVPLDRSLYEVINDLRPTWGRGPIQSHLARFGFTGDAVQRSSSTLSGGERARLALAMIMLSHANFLLLDEPTNHLDIESIEALQDAVEGYTGTVLLVSHDRALLRALATRVWSLDDRRITDFHGDFEEWEAARAERARAPAKPSADSKALKTNAGIKRHLADRKASHGRQNTHRSSKRTLDEVEGAIAELERRVAELTGRLGDPSLYANGEGAREAARLDAELQEAQRELGDAMDRWAELMAQIDAD
ncbi:MAG TPA: ABC-F family ATP-binding cassette domain-containing protein [Gemmatimonadaceae bacterium]|nr:ABC-F family ATP-binding cassette domain-containing protein [Gemmatimonadaceae bacterium]